MDMKVYWKKSRREEQRNERKDENGVKLWKRRGGEGRGWEEEEVKKRKQGTENGRGADKRKEMKKE